MTKTETWCVCARESDREPWEAVKGGLSTYEAAEEWMIASYERYPEYRSYYIDRESNDGVAEHYFDVTSDGGLSMTN
jgi:antirestriction protein